MLDLLFSSVLNQTASTSSVAAASAGGFALCTIASILCGLVCAFVYMYRHDYSKGFVVTLAIMPVIVQMVILLVNGNLGAGIAVMGVFNLVRFRSIAGTAKDIGSVFLAMAIGLATGMGYLGLAVLLTVVVAILNFVYVTSGFGEAGGQAKLLKITVPEDLQFEGMFDQVLSRYSGTFKLEDIETTNMGSLYQLRYRIVLRESASQKDLIDDLRCLNGNLKISLSMAPVGKEML